MIFGSSSPRNQKRGTTLVLHIDVGEGSSRAAIVSSLGPTPEMLFTAARAEKVTKGAHGKTVQVTLASLRALLEDVVQYLSKHGKGRGLSISNIYAILGSPYYLSHTALIKYNEPKGFAVTPLLVSNLLSGYRKSTDPEYESHEEVKLGDTPMTVTERVLQISVNGYHTDNPYGKHATSLQMSVFKTEADSEIVLEVRKEVEKHFRTRVMFEPLSLAAYVALRDHVQFEPDFLFVVIGSEVTEVSLVRGFALLETVSFPFGKHSLIRRVARDLKAPEDEVSGTLMLFSKNELHEDEKARVLRALETARAQWFPFFEKAIVSLSDESAVPNAIHLVSDPETDLIFKSFIETDSFAGQSLVPSGFSVDSVDVEKAKSIMHFSADASCDILLCLEGLFALSPKMDLPKNEV